MNMTGNLAGIDERLVELLAAEGTGATAALDAWAQHTPLKVFIHYGEHGLDLSYAEAARATDTIAGNLASLGVRRGDRVAVHCHSPYAAALWIFGVWKAGAVLCPLDPDAGPAQLLDQLSTLAPALVVTESAGLPALELIRPHLRSVPPVTVHDAVGPRVAHGYPDVPYTRFLGRGPAPGRAGRPDDTAAVWHTAGTTGRPKAVVQCHRWVAQYVALPRQLTAAGEVVYTDLPMHQPAAALGVVVRAAYTGSTVALWDRFRPDQFWARITRTGAGQAALAPGALSRLLDAEGPRDNPLTTVWVAGLPASHGEFARRFGVDFTVNTYSHTEAGMPLACVLEELAPGEGTPAALRPREARATAEGVREERTNGVGRSARSYGQGLDHDGVRRGAAALGVPVVPGADITRKGLLGAPLPFLEVAVLDDRDRPAPPGAVGELAVRPRVPNLVMREYLGDGAATGEALRNLWLHTGDAVVQDPDTGLVHLVDRVADRIRTGGQDVSAYHIEDLVNQNPQIAFGAVFGVPGEQPDGVDGPDGQVDDDIVLYAEGDPGSYPDPAAIHRWCTVSLPAYMRPRYIRVVAKMPRAADGRVEKGVLRRHFLGVPETRQMTVLPPVPVVPRPGPLALPGSAG